MLSTASASAVEILSVCTLTYTHYAYYSSSLNWYTQVARLVRGATSVRALVRVKIADDNDLNTAREALATMAGFFKRVSEEAARRGGGCTAFDVLQERRTQSPAAFLKPLPSASTTAAAAASAAATAAATAAASHRSAGSMARPRIRVTGAAAAAAAASGSSSGSGSNGNSGGSSSSGAATNGAHSHHHVSKQSAAADSSSSSSVSSNVVGASLEQLKRRRMPAADDSRPSAYVS
jgi:trimeric autotransporter adhesin